MDRDDHACKALQSVDDNETTWYTQYLFAHNEKRPKQYAGKEDLIPRGKREIGRSISQRNVGQYTFRSLGGRFALMPQMQLGHLIRSLAIDSHPYDRVGASPDIPMWAFSIEISQSWKRIGNHRGRLVRSLPLAAGETLQIAVKSWETHKNKRASVESMEKDTSSEVIGDEKWVTATKKQFINESNSTTVAGASVNQATIPIGKVPVTLGGNLGIENTNVNKISSESKRSREYVKNRTTKAATSLKTVRNNSVETESEFGVETTSTHVLSNPNKCHSLTYHFYEVMERYELTTRVDDVGLLVALPLPVPEVTAEWLLCNECYIRPQLPCETFYAGFDAARALLAEKKLRAREHSAAESGGSSTPTVDTSGINTAIDAVLNAYEELSGNPVPTPRSAQEGSVFRPRTASRPQYRLDADSLEPPRITVPDDVQKTMQTLMNVDDLDIEQSQALRQQLHEGIDRIMIEQPSGESVPVRQYLASTASPDAPSTGEGLYWDIVNLCHYELVEAMQTLVEQCSVVDAQDATATLDMVDTFFSILGDYQHAFFKIGVAAGLFAPGALTAALLFGAPPFGSILILTIAGLIWAIDALGIELLPKSRGLKGKVSQLRASATALRAELDRHAIPAPADESGDATEARLETEQLAAARRERLANQEVELERLQCHVSEHLYEYSHTIWRNWHSTKVDAELRRNELPSYLFEHEFVDFVGMRGLVRVHDADELASLTRINLDEIKQTIFDDESKRREAAPEDFRSELLLPGRGMVMEPVRGECNGCDEFVQQHREFDLENRRIEVDSAREHMIAARLENSRIERRIADGDLSDPTPYEGQGSSYTLNHLSAADDLPYTAIDEEGDGVADSSSDDSTIP